jgi:hypothetical protein
VAERELIRPRPGRRLIGKIGIVLYALFMAFVQSHYITAQLYPGSEYFFGVWYGISNAQLMMGAALAIFANIGLLLSPFLATPRRLTRLLMLLSLAAGAIVATIHLTHMFRINALYPFWPQELDPNLPQDHSLDHIDIEMFLESLVIYAIDLFAIYLYLTNLKLSMYSRNELRKPPLDTDDSEDPPA